MRAIWTLAFAGLLASAAPALADPAADLKATLLSEIAALEDRFPAVSIEHGEPVVEPAAAGFRVGLPAVALAFVGGERLQLGDLAMTVVPQDDGTFVFDDLAMAESFDWLDAKGEKSGLISLQGVRLSGVYWPALRSFRTGRIALDNLTVVAAGVATTFSLSDLEWTGQANQRENLWDFVQNFQVAAIDVGSPEIAFSAGPLHGYEVDFGIDPQVLGQWFEFVDGLSVAGSDAAKRQDTLGAIADLTSPFAAVVSRVDIADVRLASPVSDLVVSLERLTYGGEAWDLDRPLARAQVVFEGRGLRIAPSPSEGLVWQLLPNDWRLPIAVDRAPTGDILQALVQFYVAALDAPAESDDVMIERLIDLAFGSLGERMRAVGTEITVPGMTLDTPLGRQSLKAGVALDADSVNGVHGSVEVTLTGLEEVMARGDGAATDEIDRSILAVLPMLIGFGERQPNSMGPSSFLYRIELPRSGEPTLNGLPLSALTPGFAQ